MTNRLKSLTAVSARTQGSSRFSRRESLFASDAAEDGYVLFTPLHYEPNYAYPLIVWLHADGEDEQVLGRIMADVSLRNYVAVAPRGTVPMARPTNSARGGGFSWLETGKGLE